MTHIAFAFLLCESACVYVHTQQEESISLLVLVVCVCIEGGVSSDRKLIV